MADTATAQLKRLLQLIPRLADESDHSLEEVAEAAGSSVKQVLTDLESISERFDVPGGFVEGVSIFIDEHTVSVHTSHFRRPMRLTMPELCALELGLTLIRRERTPVEQAPIDRALVRLRSTISKVPANDAHEGTRYADLAAAGSAEHLTLLRAAVRDHRKVRLTYRSSAATTSTTRIVCPHSLAFTEQMWYVASTCEDATVRFFRLDRMHHVELLAEPFAPDDAVTARVMDNARPFNSTTTRHMTVRYSPRIARWVAEREGKLLAEDGSLTLEHPVADESWAIRHVLQYGPEAELLSPPDLRALIARRLDELVITA